MPGKTSSPVLFARDGRDKSSLSFRRQSLDPRPRDMDLVRGELKTGRVRLRPRRPLREIGYGMWEGRPCRDAGSGPQLYAKRQTEKWTVSPPGRRELCRGPGQDAGLVRLGDGDTWPWPMAVPPAP